MFKQSLFFGKMILLSWFRMLSDLFQREKMLSLLHGSFGKRQGRFPIVADLEDHGSILGQSQICDPVSNKPIAHLRLSLQGKADRQILPHPQDRGIASAYFLFSSAGLPPIFSRRTVRSFIR